MHFIKQIAMVVGIVFLLTGCGVDNNTNAPGFESALVQVPLKDRRIAIVHSQTSKAGFYDPFAYNQLFASVQHQSMMAGIPFDLLDEAGLASTANLLDYDLIVIPSFTRVNAADRAAIKTRLLQAQENGVGLIASGEFLSLMPDGSAFADYSSAMVEVLGVEPTEFLSGVAASVRVANNTHPVSKVYQPDEELTAYEQIWFGHFTAVEGEQSTPLTLIRSGAATYNGAQIIDRASRVVHFANEEVMADNNLLWRVIQWMVYGDVAPVSLQVSRSDHVFLARNDMDQAMIAAELAQTEIPLLEIIKEWKRDYNFVGSYYIDIGNNPAAGEYTDWGVSAPLYQQYIALGNEIGTHSWTHPHHTSDLTAEELKFEFQDSAAEIATQMGVPVAGAAVPGNSESLFVVETLNPWLDYLSGRSGTVGSGYPGAFGFLEPQHDMMYFSLNLSPDFGLIDFQNYTPAQAKVIWKSEIDNALKHAQRPIVHWLWHDYGPTTQTAAGLYTKDMFTDTIAYAKDLGAEFTTVDDMHKRIRTFAGANLTVGSSNVINASVTAAGVGQFALKVADDVQIKKVENWYAYDDAQVFLPEDGGQFEISLGPVADAVTHITQLPMRARLITLTGDGNQLSFSMQGEGEVTIELSEGMKQNVSVTGADSFTENEGVLTLRFNSSSIYNVEITAVAPINTAPVAPGGSIEAESSVTTSITLSGSDSDGDVLSYLIQTQPVNGTLAGTAPNLVYVSNAGYEGADSFSYLVNDGAVDSESAQFTVVVTLPPPPNTAPLANELVLETVVDQPLPFRLSGSDNENQPLSFAVTGQPASGVISGTVPDLIYTPNAGFSGRDSIEFTVSDSAVTSTPGTVVFNVEPQLSEAIGTISNPAVIALDGNITDWGNLVSFGEEPQEVTGVNNTIDWREAWMGHDATHLYLAYREYDTAQLLWGNQIFIDTDSDSVSGFRGFSREYTIGADYMIEGNALFRYDSDLQDQWLWTFIGSVETAVNGDTVELKLARSALDNPDNLLLFFRGDSSASSGDALDFYPDSVADPAAVLRSRRFSYSVNPNPNIENFAPIAFSQSIKISNNASYPLTLTGFDQDGDPLDFVVDTQPTQGTLTGVAPNLVYTPNVGATQDLIAFRVNDGTAFSNSRSVQFFMLQPPSVNNRPSANNQTLSVAGPSASLSITLTGSDVDGDALSYRVINQPTTGTLAGTPPDLTYTASANIGVDSFTYVVSDGVLDSAAATVTVNVEALPPVNMVPQASGLSLTTAFDTAIGVTLDGVDADGDTLSYTVVTQPLLGTLTGTPPQLTYVPFNAAVGSDSFTFKVSDGIDDSAVATVAIDVLPQVLANRAPEANGQALATAFGMPLNIVLSGRDPEQSVLSYSTLTQPLGGTITGTAPNLIYTPDAAFTGVDSFTFEVFDGELNSPAAAITIDVGPAPSGAISNPVSTMTVDGALSDWNGLQTLGTDPADIAGIRANNPLDWRQAWVAHSTTDLFIAYRNHEAVSLSWGHGIYVDVDGDINTGFRGFYGEFPIGADYLIETDDVQRYTGTGNNWGWITVSQATVATAGEIAELSFPLSAFNPQGVAQSRPQNLQFYFRANNSAFGGDTVDNFPDAANDIAAPSAQRSLAYQLAP